MGIALAIAAAISWGGSDYIAGLATRRSTPLAVAALSQLAGLCLVIVLAPLVPGQPTAADLGWGALAGIASAAGLVALYWGLAIGPMSVVAPVSAGVSAVIPVVIGTALGQRPEGATLIGVILALIAIVALSSGTEKDVGHAQTGRLVRSTPAALIAGIGFGMYLVSLDRTGHDAGLWPIVAARVTSVPLLWSLLLTRRPSQFGGIVPPALTAGALDVAAGFATLLALHHQSLPIVAVIGSLSPAATVALAGLVANEPMGARRLAWCGLALGAIALIAAS
jgi:drug/metabolite transporter (DMT)-like permease